MFHVSRILFCTLLLAALGVSPLAFGAYTLSLSVAGQTPPQPDWVGLLCVAGGLFCTLVCAGVAGGRGLRCYLVSTCALVLLSLPATVYAWYWLAKWPYAVEHGVPVIAQLQGITGVQHAALIAMAVLGAVFALWSGDCCRPAKKPEPAKRIVAAAPAK